uniref:Ref family recombination enhancement nuclease n=1 Tax=Salmonella sp. TaxID=599 RepID=UPI003994288B
MQTAISASPHHCLPYSRAAWPSGILHHIFGERLENARRMSLPLCKWHHQYAAPMVENNIHDDYLFPC